MLRRLHTVQCHQAVLYCAVLCCTVLYCTVLYCTVLYCTAPVELGVLRAQGGQRDVRVASLGVSLVSTR